MTSSVILSRAGALLISALLIAATGCASHPPADAAPRLSGDAATTSPTTSASQAASETLHVAGGAIEIIQPPSLSVSPDAIHDWVMRAATAVSQFYGRFPVRRVTLTIRAGSRGAIQGGAETAGRTIRISLGRRAQPADLLDDWTLTHEMFHLSQPQLYEQYSWMSEGMADYLEPVARVRVGQITPEKFWKDLVEGLPQGLPEPGDKGLDNTRTWGRTYWGGSLFWLLADVRIRQQTHNAKSVRDAARAVLDAGGDGAADWDIDRLLQTYDRGTGTRAFQTLHNQMGSAPVQTDLPALWKSLGVLYTNGRITYDDTAPLAEIRRKITSP